MLLGIVAALFMVPPSTPLRTFGIISGAVFLLGNVLLISKVRSVRDTVPQGLSPERKRRLNSIIVLFALYWLLCFFLRKR
jgi:hypothetical protein